MCTFVSSNFDVQSHHPGGTGELCLFLELMTLVEYHKKREESEKPNHLDSNRSYVTCNLHSRVSQ